jgi:hypothetical protein
MEKSFLRLIFSAGVCSLALPGCYTQFSTLDSSNGTADKRNAAASDSITDSAQTQKEFDTVIVKDRQICYWHRDFFGNRVLRCYKTYYDTDWYDYYNQPWWYGSYTGYRPDCDCNCTYGYSSGYPGYYSSGIGCDDNCYWYCRSMYDRNRRLMYGGGPSYGGSSSSSSTTSVPSVRPPRPSVRSGIPSSTGITPAASTSSTSAATPLDTIRKPEKTIDLKPVTRPEIRQGIAPEIGVKGRGRSEKIDDIPVEKSKSGTAVSPGTDSPSRAMTDTTGKSRQQDRKRHSVRQW